MADRSRELSFVDPDDQWELRSVSGELLAVPGPDWGGPSTLAHAFVWARRTIDRLCPGEPAYLDNPHRSYRRYLNVEED